ncbi:AAA family ATPase [Thermobifida halotolerans]|uniref:AAA family ATPase n=1 Tax=Thermobifida halotolerans TaxID=483545 RepID=A0AA97M543_9ACTN|nr:RNA ligase family protein [Thermobifida halotolerans]UOE20650.1 AAA family ATPase [Thermobifida halotolerans]
MRLSYPRTPHLPWSPGATPDDARAAGVSGLVGREVVVTEKLDGENTTLYRDGLHARSVDSAHHPSRAWTRALHGRIAHALPPGRRVCGENLYARHSIAYTDLDSWFYAFSVWDGEHCLDWDATVRFARRLGVPVPPVLWRGVFDERALRALRLDTARQEGYVVRTVEGFRRDEFAHRVAKWVRPGHVRTGEHWMSAPVVANGLGRGAALWEVRSGAEPDAAALLAALDLAAADLCGPATATPGDVARAEAAAADAAARLDLLGRTGDARLAGVLAALFHRARRAWLAPRLADRLGPRLARRTADLVGLHGLLHRDLPDEKRRTGLARMSEAADLGVLHALAAAALTGRDDAEAREARDRVAWSELHAEDAGLLGETPLEGVRARLREEFVHGDPDVADRCWAEARRALAEGRITTAEEAVALTWRWRGAAFCHLVVTVGPSGSGKSTFARSLPGVCVTVSLDELRRGRGSRADQSANRTVLGEGLRRLDTALSDTSHDGCTVVWDATALNRHQRFLVHAVARRRDALVTHAVWLLDEDTLARRNVERRHPVPPEVLADQVRRYEPPYPGEAHRTWYVGADGGVRDTAGVLDGEED